jgi:hypothetical protein
LSRCGSSDADEVEVDVANLPEALVKGLIADESIDESLSVSLESNQTAFEINQLTVNG